MTTTMATTTTTVPINPASPSLAHLTPTDRVLFTHYGQAPRRSVSYPIIHHAFEMHAQRQPHAIAVEHTLFNEHLSYADLDARANRLARRLRRDYDVRPGKRVCILARRSTHLVVAILAVLKSGAQYVPLDAVTITDDTLQYVLGDAAPSLTLVMREYSHRVPATASASLCLEDAIEDDILNDEDATKPEDLTSPSDGAYIIYTSGTTGVPKGVDVRHSGVTNVISGSPGNVGMRPGLRVAQLLNIAFDMGAWEILGSLYNGCTLCLRGNSSKEWAALLKTVDIVIATPSILARHDPEVYPNIKEVIVGGEPCPQALADRWARVTAFNNCCGPTEISIMNTAQRHTPGYPLSIGKPIPNTHVYILSSTFSPSESTDPATQHPEAVPIGSVGCMWVGGIGVSRGYLNLPTKTAERWLPDPFVVQDGLGEGPNGLRMMFNTGDLGRWRKDGQLAHHGRADDQVKVKGFRVELDGVSAAMRSHPEVEHAVALLIDTTLWGFVSPSTIDLSLVRAATAQKQPYYAVPTEFLALDDMPTTKNGKVDKRRLREIVESQGWSTTTSGSDIVKKGLKVGPAFSPTLPGTPMVIAEPRATQWEAVRGRSSPLPPPSPSSASSFGDSASTTSSSRENRTLSPATSQSSLVCSEDDADGTVEGCAAVQPPVVTLQGPSLGKKDKGRVLNDGVSPRAPAARVLGVCGRAVVGVLRAMW